MSYADTCDINNLIGENINEEPKVLLWNGRTCREPDDGTYRRLGPGTYDCGYAGCDNTQNIWHDAVDGMWIPPNQYVYVWNDFQRDILEDPVRDQYDTEDKTMSIDECGDKSNVNFCGAEKVVTKVKKIYYGNSGQTCGRNLTGSDFTNPAKFMYAKNTINRGEIINRLPDTCYGQCKVAKIDYECGRLGVVIPSNRPNGVYGPGFYDNMRSSGEFDNSKYLPDPYFYDGVNSLRGTRANINALDTVVVRRSRPWKDHVRECCFQTNENPMNSKLCGVYDGKTDRGRQYCKSFLSECTADDIKLGGRCYDLCETNPAECDSIKNTFCTAHPNDPFCDCINYQTRKEYIDFTNKYPVLKSYPRTCVYNRCRLTDQDQIFLTENIKSELQNAGACADVNQIINNISGSNNVITGMNQSINTSDNSNTDNSGNATAPQSTFLTRPLSSSATGISKQITPFNLLILFVFLIFIGYFIFGESDSQKNMYMQPGDTNMYSVYPNVYYRTN